MDEVDRFKPVKERLLPPAKKDYKKKKVLKYSLK